MINYAKLNDILKLKGITKSKMGKDLSLSSRTVAKIKKGEPLSRITKEKISTYLGCDIKDLGRVSSDNLLLEQLRNEKDLKISGGIYHELQIRMAYNSNHMEGSKLTEDDTRMIFETNTIDAKGILVDDVLETIHHFKAFDYCIEKAEEPLTEKFIKELHYIIKHDTKDASLNWFMVGDYKKRGNMVGGQETVEPEDVSKKMNELLNYYHSLSSYELEDIVEFHVRFERIHPFRDGNGRVGRLIAFKECLKHNIIPFILEDKKKMFYYRGLKEWDIEKGYLLGTCMDGQDLVVKLLNVLKIEI